ncbi:DUF1365 domain-containing protein [Variovorax guangxiensis]|uniref:DUF1365 domain-containing protein n=1 Tax=Variovorax guangxiensis TaxID=1775474 RepID=A0A840FVH0_9BURK|nr:DUF1365 family protein [Variovorax guangxiensis]MBB4220708.1 hypothetical protein [Variovorax guangxiensis]
MSGQGVSALYVGRVMHQRLRPRRHRLAYRIYSVLVDIDELPQLHARLRLFSVDRFNLFSFHAADYGDGSGRDLRAQVEALLRVAGLPTGGAIRLLTMPRLLGHVFNPLSVWFCHAPGGELQAMVYEVNNTFGQRHSYLIPVADAAAPVIDQRCDKRMYVSPFNGMDLRYRFRIAAPGESVSIGVSVHDADGAVLNARQDGQRTALSDLALLRVFLTHPLLTLKVVAAIHWQALRLWIKRVPLHPRPAAPERDITIVSTSETP